MLFGHRLSEQANEWIQRCTRRETIRDRIELTNVLQQNDIPTFRSLLDFQEKYGGVHYYFGGPLNQSCTLDVMNRSITGFDLPKTFSHGDQVVVQCLHFIRDGYPMDGYMDNDGKLYLLVYETLNLIANHIVEFLENEAMKYSLVSKQKQWVVKTLYESEAALWLSNAKQNAIYLSQSSHGSSKWWKSQDNRLYVHIQSGKGVNFKAVAYAAEASDLKQLGLESTLLIKGFPFTCYYDAEKELAEIEHTREMYYFNHRCYKTCDYSRVTVTQLKEVKDLYLYLTGQKEYPIHRPIEELLNKMPHLSLPAEDYDPELLEFANQNGDDMILKLISYLANMDPPIQKRRTAAENHVDGLLFQEYLRRVSVFVEEYPMKVHPLYFHPYQAAGLSAEVDIEEEYPVLNRINQSYAPSISKRTLLYMKVAQQGNAVAGQIYSIYEPLLLLFSLGGFISKEHGFIEVGGGAFHQGAWQALVAKEPIDIYDRIPEAWNHRNWEYAIGQINRIKWDNKRGRQSTSNAELMAAFARLEGESGIGSSKFALSFVPEDQLNSDIFIYCPSLRLVEGTIAHGICINYLKWAARLDQKNPIAIQNPCLYEPFIELLCEEDQIELWNTRAIDLIQHMNEEAILNYADVLRSAY
ncbi:hypothetical protein D3C76_491830 [compost metagenome]